MAISNATRNRYCLFRHGESESNVREVINSLPAEALVSGGLTETGTSQVQAAAERLRELPEAAGETVIIASDFLRARQTAELVAPVLGAEPPSLDSRLRERACPLFHGKTAAEFRRVVWSADKRGETSPGCESVNDVFARLAAVVRGCESGGAGRLVVLVTHCDPARIFLARWLGERVTQHFKLGALPTAGWYLLPAEPHADARSELLCPASS